MFRDYVSVGVYLFVLIFVKDFLSLCSQAILEVCDLGGAIHTPSAFILDVLFYIVKH